MVQRKDNPAFSTQPGKMCMMKSRFFAIFAAIQSYNSTNRFHSVRNQIIFWYSRQLDRDHSNKEKKVAGSWSCGYGVFKSLHVLYDVSPEPLTPVTSHLLGFLLVITDLSHTPRSFTAVMQVPPNVGTVGPQSVCVSPLMTIQTTESQKRHITKWHNSFADVF